MHTPKVDTSRMSKSAKWIIENSRRARNIARDKAKAHRHR